MSSIILPRRFTSQPQYPALPKSAYSGTLIVNYGTSNYNLVNGAPPNLYNGRGSTGVGNYGKWKTGYDGGTGIAADKFSYAPLLNFTLFALFDSSAGSGSYSTIIGGDSNSGTREFQFRFNSSNGMDFIRFDTSVTAYTVSTASATSRVGVAVAVSSGTSFKAYINGQWTPVGSISGNPQAATQAALNGSFGYDAVALSADKFYCGGVIPRALADGEAVQLANDIWQIFQAPPRKLWVSGGSSNNFYGNAYQKINSLGGMSVSMPVSAASIQSLTSSAATTGSTPLSGSATQTIASVASFNVALYLAANAIQSVLSSANLAGSSPLLGNNTETITSSGNITSTVIPSYLSGASLQEIVSTATLQASAILHGGAIIDSFSGATFYIPSGGVGQNPNSASIAYSPGKVPDNVPDLQRFLTLQLSQIAAVIRLLAAGHIDVTYVAPAKPRDGDIRYADGTKWNPGSGSGVYRYDGAAWHYLG
jgi:hypothetical protein